MNDQGIRPIVPIGTMVRFCMKNSVLAKISSFHKLKDQSKFHRHNPSYFKYNIEIKLMPDRCVTELGIIPLGNIREVLSPKTALTVTHLPTNFQAEIGTNPI